ncbi:MAG: DUF433 domain-containing protein [Isosphaeraceae bacterium]
MSIHLHPTELQYLKRLLARKAQPTRRQMASALLLLSEGKTPVLVSQIVGIPKHQVEALEEQYKSRGKFALLWRNSRSARKVPEGWGIDKTAGVCGGSARIAGTRIPVWQLVAARNMGVGGAQLLLDYPTLRAEDLVNAWSYSDAHPEEIQAEIHENEVA